MSGSTEFISFRIFLSCFIFGVPAYVPTIWSSGFFLMSFSAVFSATPFFAPRRNTFDSFRAASLQIFLIKSTPVIRSGRTVRVYDLLKGIIPRLTIHFETRFIFESDCLVMFLNFDAHKIPIPSGILKFALFRIRRYLSSFCAASSISGFGVTIVCFLWKWNPGSSQLSIFLSASFSVVASKFTPRIFIFSLIVFRR